MTATTMQRTIRALPGAPSSHSRRRQCSDITSSSSSSSSSLSCTMMPPSGLRLRRKQGTLLRLSCSAATPIKPLKKPPAVVSGATTATFLFGKLQRAAQLPSSDLGSPYFVVTEDPNALEKVLWEQFCMASVSDFQLLPRGGLGDGYREALGGALWFVESMQSEALSGRSLASRQRGAIMELLGFGRKGSNNEPGDGGNAAAAAAAAALGPNPLDTLCLKAAASGGAGHIYVGVEDADGLREAEAALEGLPSLPPVTIFVPEAGFRVRSTSGWESKRPQDLEGELSGAVAVRLMDASSSSNDNGAAAASAAGDDAAEVISREDFAEVMLQVALRLPRSEEEGAPPRRVVVVAGGSSDGLEERLNASYFTLTGGKTMRAAAGTVQSIDWEACLAPLGSPVQSYKTQ